MHRMKPFLMMDVLAAMTCLLLTGCMVGPNFHSPAAPHPHAYTDTPLPHKTAQTKAPGNSGKAQYYQLSKTLPTQWWELFHSKEINQLVEQGIAHNPSLTAAYATLRAAQEAVNVQVGNSLFPAVNTQLSGQRTLFNSANLGGSLGSEIFNIFNANVGVTYTLDVFGGARRQIESLMAQVDYQQFKLIGVYLTLTTNIVTTSVAIAAYEKQIKTTRELVNNLQEQLLIIKKQYQYGGVSEENILTQQTLLEQTRATLPPLEQNLSQSKHALDVLIGALPNHPVPVVNLDKMNLPSKLPVTLPSQLVRQRPDVRASEALLHAATANIGVATANLFPSFTLNGSYGWQAGTPATLFATTTNTWTVGASIAQPIFHGGALLAARRQAKDAFDAAFAQYKVTVLQAFQNVADALRALEYDAKTLKALNVAVKSAYKNYKLTSDQYKMGGVSYLNLLTAQLQYQQAVLARIQAQASRYNDTAALFQALGGGWWNQTWCVKECLYEAS